MTLSEILVDYNQVVLPKKEYIEPKLPISRFQYLSDYVENKPEETTTENTSEQKNTFTKWTYRQPSTKTDKRPTIVQQSARWSSPYKDQKNWVADMTAAYKRYGLNDNAIKNLIAKNSLESAWGTSAQGDYNFGNLTTGKYWKGRFVEGGDKDKNGKPIRNKFRAYDSLDDFVKDEIQFLTTLYDFDQNDNLSQFLNKLQGGNSAGRRYAEDPNYKNKIRSRYLKI